MNKELIAKAEAKLEELKKQCVTWQQRAELRAEYNISARESERAMFNRIAMILAKKELTK